MSLINAINNNDEALIVHNKILKQIKKNLSGVEKDLQKQLEIFRKSNSSVKNRTVRKEKGYGFWTKEVIKRFNSQCCICFSSEKVVAHHLYSYKYYLQLRTNVDNGVCLCNKCHVKFHEVYDIVNTASQFFEFMKIMKSDRLKNYLLNGFPLMNVKSHYKFNKKDGLNPELIKLTHITFLINSEEEVDYEVKNKYRDFRLR